MYTNDKGEVILLSIGQNIKRLRESHGMNQSELAEIAGVSDKAVSTWENDIKTPRMGAIQKMADYFGITKSAIIEEDPHFSLPVHSVVRIPVVGAVVAGIPTEAVEDVVDWEEIPNTMAQRGDYIGLKVKGSSMEPRFLDGDTVIVRRQPDVESGEIAIVFVNGDAATMKKVLKQDEGITLVALNTSVYEPHFYSNKQIASLPVTIYGKVVELRGKF